MIGQTIEKKIFFSKLFFGFLTVAISSNLVISHSALRSCPTSPYQRTEKDLTDKMRLFFFFDKNFFPIIFVNFDGRARLSMEVLLLDWVLSTSKWKWCQGEKNSSSRGDKRRRKWLPLTVRGYRASPSPSPFISRLTMGVVPLDWRLNASR